MFADILLFFATLVLGIRTFIVRNKYKKLMVIFNKRDSLINLIIMFLFILISLFEYDDSDETHTRLIDSIKKGLIAFIIAIYGELGMLISPFWTVFLVSYFLSGWV